MFDKEDIRFLTDFDKEFPGASDVNGVISEIIEYARIRIVEASSDINSNFSCVHPAVMLALLSSNLISHFLEVIIVSRTAKCRMEQVKSLTKFIKQLTDESWEIREACRADKGEAH